MPLEGMKLKSMRLPKRKSKKSRIVADEPDMPAFPWGLNVNLNDDSLNRLGIAENLPRVGDKVIVYAIAEVTSVSERENRDKTMDRDVTIQMQEMEVKPMPRENKSLGGVVGRAARLKARRG